MTSMNRETHVEQAYQLAKERYAELGVDVESALRVLIATPISLQCWQGDDVRGFEPPRKAASSGGIQATGNYPGAARNAEELRSDLDLVYSLLPGKHRLNLHASYAETGGRAVERDELEPDHFNSWIDWARDRGLGLDFNPTCFAHPLADDGFTLSHADGKIRGFWVDHCRACRQIGLRFGKELGTACITNIWIPDGYKDIPFDRQGPRERLLESLDQIIEDRLDPRFHLDSVEPKLFGIGSESYVVGSHEFYLGYALTRGTLLTLDTGHYHPTEVVSDKISAVMTFLDRMLLHVSRGVRWDSDHVVILSDELLALSAELVRGGYLNRVHIGLDFFDASINRVAAWVIGAQAVQKALLIALLEPRDILRDDERSGDYSARLARLEAHKGLPWGAVWDWFCQEADIPPGGLWLETVRDYEKNTLSKRP